MHQTKHVRDILWTSQREVIFAESIDREHAKKVLRLCSFGPRQYLASQIYEKNSLSR